MIIHEAKYDNELMYNKPCKVDINGGELQKPCPEMGVNDGKTTQQVHGRTDAKSAG